MTAAVVRQALVAAGAVTALVPAESIEAIRRTQSFPLPAITLQTITKTPFNHLLGHAGLDANLVQLDVYADTQTKSLAIAVATRAALSAAGYLMTDQSERNEPETDPELFQITQTWSVFT